MIKPITRNRKFNPATDYMFKVGEQKNSVHEVLEILGCLVVIARHTIPRLSLRGAKATKQTRSFLALLGTSSAISESNSEIATLRLS